MLLPVVDRRLVARKLRKLSLHKIEPGFPRNVHVRAVSVHKVHRYVHDVVAVLFKPEIVVENPRERARAIVVRVPPHVGAHGLIPGVRAVHERGVGEHRRRERLQREGRPELAHHVSLALEIQVDLNRARAKHHVVSASALLRHVRAHNLIPPFRHHRHLGHRPLRVKPDSQESVPLFPRQRVHGLDVPSHLLVRLRQVLQRRAREFKLSTRLERHALLVLRAPDDVIRFVYRRPPVSLDERAQDVPHDWIIHPSLGRLVVPKLFVLRPDPASSSVSSSVLALAPPPRRYRTRAHRARLLRVPRASSAPSARAVPRRPARLDKASPPVRPSRVARAPASALCAPPGVASFSSPHLNASLGLHPRLTNATHSSRVTARAGAVAAARIVVVVARRVARETRRVAVPTRRASPRAVVVVIAVVARVALRRRAGDARRGAKKPERVDVARP